MIIDTSVSCNKIRILIGKRLLKNPVDASIFIVTHQKVDNPSNKDWRQGIFDMGWIWEPNISSGLAEI